MTSQKNQSDLDILKELKSNMQEFTQQTQQQFREVFHLIEDLTIDVNSQKRQINLLTSQIQNMDIKMEQGCAEKVESLNHPQAAYLNEEFEMQEVAPNIEGIISYPDVFLMWLLYPYGTLASCKTRQVYNGPR